MNQIRSFEEDCLETRLIVLGAETAEKYVAKLLDIRQPVAIVLNQADVRYHKLSRLLSMGHCVVLAEDQVGAKRIRLVSDCPIFDAQSGSTLLALQAFAKNLLFIRETRNWSEMRRIPPNLVRGHYGAHILLQVDSFTQGGMENVVIDLAQSLQARDYQVTIANLGDSGDAALKAEERGLKVISLVRNQDCDDYRSWLKNNHVDLVNAHYSTYGAAICHDEGIPFVQTIHNSYVWLDPEQCARYREADDYTERYFCVSVTAARYADFVLGLDAGKMRVVPNGIDPCSVDVGNFDKNREELRGAWGVGFDAPVFINVASIMATKAQLPLVRAFSKVVESIPKARLIILGTVMEVAYHNALKKAVHDLHLEESVLFAGYDRNVARYYHAADVFVLPSYWEGWSLSLGEAMANGLACVVTDVGSAQEFEVFDNVEVVSPPFGDIVDLNYQNLGEFVYGENVEFESRLADAMIKMAYLRRPAPDVSITERLDRHLAYDVYADIFDDMIVRGVQ